MVKRKKLSLKRSPELHWRNVLHKEFDQLWKNSKHFMSRTCAYEWLAKQMNKDAHVCHIALFNEKECKKALKKVRKLLKSNDDSN